MVSLTNIQLRMGADTLTALTSDGTTADIVAECISNAGQFVAAYRNDGAATAADEATIADIAIYYLYLRRGRVTGAVQSLFNAAVSRLELSVARGADMGHGAMAPRVRANGRTPINLTNPDDDGYEVYPTPWEGG